MPDCTAQEELFPGFGRRRIEVAFDGGSVTSDAGLLLVRQTDLHLGLLERVARQLSDPRDPLLVRHTALELLRQRVYGIVHGYEDLNDHDRLRTDPALSAALSKDQAGASSPTLCRFEHWADRRLAWAVHGELMEQFLASFAEPPEELILDFDATDDPLHGNQEGRFFHGYYDGYCFLPLYVFCGSQLLAAYLRPAKIDAAKHAGAILKHLTEAIRTRFPDTRIVFRADSGFCRRRILSWCERNGVGYVVGLAKNARLKALAASLMGEAESGFAATGDKQRRFGEFPYAAGTWKHERRVIAKAEHSAQGANPRFVLTNLEGAPQALYERLYCARGEMENRIKECQLGLFADRTSCHLWWPNQFRLLLASLAYVLVERLRALGLAGTELAQAQAQTLRVKLLKIGAVIVRNTRRIRFFLSEHFPLREVFETAARRLKPG
jgi:hypothetical protein